MPKLNTNDLKELGQHLFDQARPMLNLYQTLADHFYPERADFLMTRNVGAELADALVDSYPILVRRDLGNSFSAMLRDGEWFRVGVNGEPDHQGHMWLDWASNRLLKIMNHRSAGFVRATKQGDHDYATFGQTVISVNPNRERNGMLYQSWHLKDCAWFEDETGQIVGVVRKWNPTRRQLIDTFGEKKLHPDVLKDALKKPFERVSVYHFSIPSSIYGDDQIEGKFPMVSIFLDINHDHLIEVEGLNHKQYVVPRFQTIAGSPYAYSPATVAGLPDARTLQAMTHTLLEAGERYARPPMIATSKVIRSDVNLAPDGITWIDDEYDERMGAGLRPITQDRGGFPIGLEMREGVVEVLSSAFYLNKLSLPDITREMTAYEVSERMKQFRRENLPLFAPLEAEYNGQLCELSFEIAMAHGFLGSLQEIPESLAEQNVEFKFESPLSRSEEEERATRFTQVGQALAVAKEYDPNIAMNVDFDTAVRDAIIGIGAPAHWLHPVEQVVQGRKMAMVQQMAASAAQMGGMTGE